MEKVYYSQPYLKTLKTKPGEATIFYPECGGQPGDSGWADDIRIVDTKKSDTADSVYVIEGGKTLDPDKEYEFKLDWNHRYRFMKMHTCQHMLSGLLFSKFGIGTVAVHLGNEYFTIEIDRDRIEISTIDSLIDIANSTIREGHDIVYHEKTHEEAEKIGLRRSIKVDGDVRLVEIKDVDLMACGGVHVANTSEIGIVMYYKQEQIRGHVRLFFKCGEDAVAYAVFCQKAVNECIDVLGCSESELSARSRSLVEQNSKMKQQLFFFGSSMAQREIEDNIDNGISVFESNLDSSFFCEPVNNYDDLALCVVSAGKWTIALKGKFSNIDFNEIRSDILVPLKAKGGGRSPLFQGIVPPEKSKLFVDLFKNHLSI